MKTLTFPLAVLFGLIVAGTAFSQGIDGSAHDFEGASWNTTGEVCITCHTPHNAMGSAEPLWNHAITTATFTVYSSSTLDATVGQPDGVSKLCMSCHDGTVGLDNFGGAGGVNYITGDGLIGTDIDDDHPISFTYDDGLSTTDGELFPPSTTNSGLGGTIQADMLFSGSMECASCHDVHNTAGVDKLLVKSNSGSALCLTCHNK